MRRKSERVKDKDKSVEKKSERNAKKSRRSSRRRKKSSSTSPEESETDEFDASFKSSKDDTGEESSSGRSAGGKNKVSHTEVDKPTEASTFGTEAEGKESPLVAGGRTRRHSKKQSADEVEESRNSPDNDGSKEEKVEGAEAKVEPLEKLKENEGKSSVWQVKSADCSSGEIKKLKLCIVRPPEPMELSPRKRKKLSRMSHREVGEAGLGEGDESAAAHSSPDEKRNTKKFAIFAVDDSKSDYRESLTSSEVQARPEDSSEEEQRGNDDSSEDIPVPKEVLVDKSVKQKESIQEISSLAIKGETKAPLEEVVKEAETLDSTLQAQSRSPVDETKLGHDSRSVECAQKSPLSRDSVNKHKIKDIQPLEHVSAQENPNKCLLKDTLPGRSSKVQSEESNVPSKETNVSDRSEEMTKTVKPTKKISIEEHVEALSKAHETTEEKSDVCNSSESTIKGQSSPEKISEGHAPSEEKDDGFPKRQSKAGATLMESSDKNSSEQNPTVIDVSTNDMISRGSSLEKSKSQDSSDSEEERLNYRKLQESKKKSHYLIRRKSDTRRKDHDSSEKTLYISVPPKENKIIINSLDGSHDRQNSSKSSKHTSILKESKTKEITGEILKLDRRKYKISGTGNEESAEEKQSTTAEEPQVRERRKISLNRSFSRVNDAQVVPDSGRIKLKDGETLDQSTTEGDDKTTDIQPNIIRKRRWGASKTSNAVKKPTLSISSDSLKHLIPEAKPLPISEVHLTEEEEDEEEEEGEVLERVREPVEKEVVVDVKKEMDEDDDTNKLADEKKLLFPLPMVPDPPEGKVGTARKISIVSADAARLQRSPSPPRHRVSSVLFVTNLVRPFTVNQLRELLARTGIIVDGGFWIDKIKSKCYVQYESEIEARETRHALHGVRWPVSNPKQLCVDYAKKEDMDLARDLGEGNHIPRKTEPLKMDRIDGWTGDQGRDKDREHTLKEDRERDRVRGKERHALGSMDVLEKSREAKMATSVREWDLGKMDLGPFDDRDLHQENRSREKERRMRKDRNHRSASPRDIPGRKIRRKDEDAPAKLLDDLFKKTKVTPCVYWLPLTADQIVVKEEMRRKHMAEHERRMAEMRKVERDRQRARVQGRTSQRRFEDRDREKRRHCSPSGSPKK